MVEEPVRTAAPLAPEVTPRPDDLPDHYTEEMVWAVMEERNRVAAHLGVALLELEAGGFLLVLNPHSPHSAGEELIEVLSKLGVAR